MMNNTNSNYKYRNKTIYCGNCNKKGHTYRYCREPVISIGILLFYEPLIQSPKNISKPIDIPTKKKISFEYEEIEQLGYSPSPPSSHFSNNPWHNTTTLTSGHTPTTTKPIPTTTNTPITTAIREESLFSNQEPYFLLICRKDTFGYVEFIRGRYDVNDEHYLTQLFREMSKTERNRIQTRDFDYLWNKMWINQHSQQYRHEYERSKQSFAIMSSSSFSKNIAYYDQKIACLWEEPEWGIPKGRRNLKESDIDCAKREFLEETGIDDSKYHILTHLKPIEETFVGTNDVRYKHIYYLAQSREYLDIKLDKTNLDQMAEVSKIGWFTASQAVKLFRPYNIEKINMIKQTKKLLKSLTELNYNQDTRDVI